MVGAREASSGGGCRSRRGLGEQGGLSERDGERAGAQLLSQRGDAPLENKLACGATMVGFSSKRK